MNPFRDQKDLISRLTKLRKKDRKLIAHVVSTYAEEALVVGPRPISIGGFTHNFLGHNSNNASDTPGGTERLLPSLALYKLSPPSLQEFDAAASRARYRGLLDKGTSSGATYDMWSVYEQVISRGLLARSEEVIQHANELSQQGHHSNGIHHEIFSDADAIAYFNTCVSSLPSRSPEYIVELARNNIFDQVRYPYLRAEDFVLCGGTCMTIHQAAIKAISRPNDVILIPAGSFDSLMDLPNKCDGIPVIIPTHETGYKLSAAELTKIILAITPHLNRKQGQKISCLVLTNPTNPTGLAYTTDELKEIGAVAIQAGIRIIVDEHYAGLDHSSNGKRSPIVSMGSLSVLVGGEQHSLHDHCFTIQGTAKLLGTEDFKVGFGITGDSSWRESARVKIAVERLEMTTYEDAFVSSRIEERAPYFPDSRRFMTLRFNELNRHVGLANQTAGRDIYSLLVQPDSGFFASLSIPSDLAKKFGIENDTDFSFYLNATTGVYTRPLAGMGLVTPNFVSTRINFTQPNSTDFVTVFERLGILGKKMIDGTATNFNPKVSWKQQSIRPVIEAAEKSIFN